MSCNETFSCGDHGTCISKVCNCFELARGDNCEQWWPDDSTFFAVIIIHGVLFVCSAVFVVSWCIWEIIKLIRFSERWWLESQVYLFCGYIFSYVISAVLYIADPFNVYAGVFSEKTCVILSALGLAPLPIINMFVLLKWLGIIAASKYLKKGGIVQHTIAAKKRIFLGITLFLAALMLISNALSMFLDNENWPNLVLLFTGICMVLLVLIIGLWYGIKIMLVLESLKSSIKKSDSAVALYMKKITIYLIANSALLILLVIGIVISLFANDNKWMFLVSNYLYRVGAIGGSIVVMLLLSRKAPDSSSTTTTKTSHIAMTPVSGTKSSDTHSNESDSNDKENKSFGIEPCNSSDNYDAEQLDKQGESESQSQGGQSSDDTSVEV